MKNAINPNNMFKPGDSVAIPFNIYISGFTGATKSLLVTIPINRPVSPQVVSAALSGEIDIRCNGSRYTYNLANWTQTVKVSDFGVGFTLTPPSDLTVNHPAHAAFILMSTGDGLTLSFS